MNTASWALWGFAATVVLTALMAGSQRLGYTRMNIPYMLGTLLTPNRDRAKFWGVLLHLLNGWIFSLAYVGAFESTGVATFWFGALIGLVHALFVLMVGLPILPGMHPRMASESRGPEPVEQLEPPGFLGLHYGVPTPVSVILAHLAFGAILGGFYPLSS